MGRFRNTEMPNLFIIGAAKCGTTSLHHYLDLHPEISMSKLKEPTYFAGHDPQIASWAIVDRSEYLRLFKGGTAYRGEASTAYSRAPLVQGVPEAIAAEAPEAKLIYLVGDPVSRVEAAVREVMSNRLGEWAFVPDDIGMRAAVGALEDPENRFVAQGSYMSQIERYLRHFPQESILVIDSDRLRSERTETMMRVFSFLGVDPMFFSPAMLEERNLGSKKKRASDTYVWLASRGPLRKALSGVPRSVRIRVFSRLRKASARTWTAPKLDQSLRGELEVIFRPEVKRLREFTGEEFAGWNI